MNLLCRIAIKSVNINLWFNKYIYFLRTKSWQRHKKINGTCKRSTISTMLCFKILSLTKKNHDPCWHSQFGDWAGVRYSDPIIYYCTREEELKTWKGHVKRIQELTWMSFSIGQNCSFVSSKSMTVTEHSIYQACDVY